MARVKDIIIKVIPSKLANEFVRKHHYSGKVVNNSNLHFGVFLDGGLHGVLSYGPSMVKSKLMGLVEGTGWDNFIELNRMAFDDYLPRNSESYCIAKTLRMIKKQAPQVKWVISFADGAQCGDGTIYRASNFILTGITKNKSIMQLPSGQTIADISFQKDPNNTQIKRECAILGIPLKHYSVSDWQKMGAKYIEGYQFRYVYFISPKWRKRLTVPSIPFSKIDEIGAGMYKGERIERAVRNEKKCDAQLQREAGKEGK